MAWSGKRLCAFCNAVRRQAYTQYSLWPAQHASPSHIHVSAPCHRPLQQFYQFISTDKTGVKPKESSIGLSLCYKKAPSYPYFTTTMLDVRINFFPLSTNC